jgi:hypothetical protein
VTLRKRNRKARLAREAADAALCASLRTPRVAPALMPEEMQRAAEWARQMFTPVKAEECPCDDPDYGL